jgi:selenocysteine lyase/cysteine desulfurase
VVTTSMEHNSVMRPLRELARCRAVSLEVVPSDGAGRTDLGGIELALEKKPRLLVVNHASNVTGAVLPLDRVGALAKAAGTLLLVDAAQSAGVVGAAWTPGDGRPVGPRGRRCEPPLPRRDGEQFGAGRTTRLLPRPA